MKNKLYYKKIGLYFLIFIFGLFFNYEFVDAACYQCDFDGALKSSSGYCPGGDARRIENCTCTGNSCKMTGSSTASKKTFCLYFNGNGGNGTESKCFSTLGNSVSFYKTKPSRDGYIFIGWSTNSSCPCGKLFNESTNFTVNSSNNYTTYYACWKPAYCWGCQYNGVYNGKYIASATQPTATCYNSSWETPSNSFGMGTWVKVNYSQYCNGCNYGTTDTPYTPQVPASACYVCNSNTVTNQIMKWRTDGSSDSDCTAGYTKDSSISEANCKSNTVPVIYCSVDTPFSSALECNSTKTLDSTCDKRTIVIDDVGYADVKIEQKGYISSVLTPNTTYSGGGFSFGVIYTNTVKWSYAGTAATGTLHTKITDVMNKKLKDYNSYIAGLNLSEVKFGGKIIDGSFLVKKCNTSNTNIDYYNKELTVTCTFYLPDSVLENDEDVTYTAGVGNSVSNKYYTPIHYNNDKGGNYSVEAKIVGMSRITDSSAKEDGNGTSWTGTWSDTFKNCEIKLYPLLTVDGGGDGTNNARYNFIYRPIDLYNPFPNRNAGINWYDWYNVERNKERLENTYNSDNLEYFVTLNNETIANIKNYNENNGSYLEWNGISDSGKSSFIDEYVTRK